jgi:metal-responsive CopG/Arc/MetJ family transcriptional regulator
MPKAKIAITLDEKLLRDLDTLIEGQRLPNRSQVIGTAIAEKLSRLARTRLARESAKLDPDAEKRLAEEGMEGELAAWPVY